LNNDEIPSKIPGCVIPTLKFLNNVKCKEWKEKYAANAVNNTDEHNDPKRGRKLVINFFQTDKHSCPFVWERT